MHNNGSGVPVIQVDTQYPDREVIEHAAQLLKQNNLVVFPTETVYGIAALYGSDAAYERLYRVKQRDRSKPFTVHIADREYVSKTGCVISPAAQRLMDHYWPGPLTLILPLATGNGTLGFRLPDHAVACALIEAAGGGVLAPSANKSGCPSPVTAQAAYEQLGAEVDLYIDAGTTGYGTDSTVVDLTNGAPVIRRQGALPAEDIYSCAGV